VAESVTSWGAASSAPTACRWSVDFDQWRPENRRHEGLLCARRRLVGCGWDDCGGGWEGGGVIEDDAPAFGKFSEIEGEDAGGLVGFAD